MTKQIRHDETGIVFLLLKERHTSPAEILPVVTSTITRDRENLHKNPQDPLLWRGKQITQVDMSGTHDFGEENKQHK